MTRTQSQQTSSVPFPSSTWFITGIGRGLGRSIAEEVLRRGARVAGTVRNPAHADELKSGFPGRLWIGKLDLSDLANIGRTFQAAAGHFGRVHAVVSNGGYSVLGAAEELDSGAFRHIVDTNLLGSIGLARALGGGRLLQISSGAGQAGFAWLSVSSATN